jgi:predicted nuclease of restriction endonuclease-like (RecB) superfamily
LRLCIQENYSKRELERQLDSGYYERYVISQGKALPEGIKTISKNPFLDSYIIEFLDLPSPYKENDFRKALILKQKYVTYAGIGVQTTI